MRWYRVVTFAICAFALGWPVAAGASSLYGLDQTGELKTTDLPAQTVILTFDDGPSPYTPQILEILKQKHVPAVFFVIGKQAVRYPQLKAIYDNGHEIGNHTYDHEDLTNVSVWKMRFELNLSRLIISSQTHHETRLFRPPYLGGADSVTMQSEDLIREVNHYGYITAGEDVDTSDWKRPGVTKIVRNATDGQAGGIILLHDGGGDRSQTVTALPEIIDYYQQRGYRFISMSEAFRISRAELMPTPGPLDMVLAVLTGVMFATAGWLQQALVVIIIALIAAGVVRMVLVVAAAIVQSRRRSLRSEGPDIPCTVVVPAHNEAAVIQSCLRSVLASDYRAFEVLVVDDGSSDETAELARGLSHPRLRVHSKPNGGKATALNYGINKARSEFIIAIDADTVFRPDTLRKLMRHFRDDRVGAVSGNTRIANRHKLITKLQSLEYVVGFNLDRRMGDLFDCITVVPGAVGAFRKPVLYEVGGFTFDTLAEDTELTLSIKEAGYRIVYDSEAVAYTEAPATLKELLKQRFRWTFGTMQAVWKHRSSFLNPRRGTLGMIGLPYLLVFQIIFPLLGPFFDLAVIACLLASRYEFILISFVAYTLADLLVSAIALKLDGEKLHNLWLLVPQRLVYRQIMYYVIARSAVNVLNGRLVGWGSLKREGKHLANASEG